MGTSEAQKKKDSAKKSTYWIENTLEADLAEMARLTDKDKSAIIHEAVRAYKRSAEYREQARKQIEADLASLKSHTSPGTGTHDKIPTILKRRRGKDDL